MKWLLAMIAATGCATERTPPDGAPASGVHPTGFADQASDAFHAGEVARRGWDLHFCASCHGDDFTGGAAKTSCRDAGCHSDAGGPTSCGTCHEAAPTTGAHAPHRTGGVGCAECHTVPARWDDDGHIQLDGRARVALGARAAVTIDPADRMGPPAYDAGTCRNVYCHGDVLHAAGGAAPQPRWSDPVTGACDRCHGAPPPSHAQDRCASCHPASAAHVDGAVQLGAGCTGCHGSSASPAPPRDLAGNMYTTAIGVGAHQVHLAVPSRLRGPIACETCHRVPASLLDAGHLDSAPPAEVALAAGWDRATATCATQCHGTRSPVWTTSGGAFCGSCHGVPPATPSHTPGMPLTGCAACHPRTIDPTGSIILTDGPTGPVSEHLDGELDLL